LAVAVAVQHKQVLMRLPRHLLAEETELRRLSRGLALLGLAVEAVLARLVTRLLAQEALAVVVLELVRVVLVRQELQTLVVAVAVAAGTVAHH
jgi:hypothetical protein